jgi:pimeloyl-ACP methyl ester carboxylesterase
MISGVSAGRPRLLVRRIVAAVKVLALLAAVALLGCAAYEEVGAWRDARMLTQVGRSVDIGGRALNIHCVGDGTPTVMFDSGRTSPGYVWMPTQRGVATFARACWYDRAGLGWSDPGPDPSWGDAAARDLHRLVDRAGLSPPFVLVGASFGGYVIRLYHHMYRGEVAGMVFVDAAHEDAGTIDGMPHRDPPRLPRGVIRALSIVGGRLGAVRMMAAEPGPPPGAWRADEWDVLTRLRRQRTVLLADAQIGPERATADLVRSTGGLENLPLIVLTQGRALPDPSSRDASVRRGWVGLQRELAERSRFGRQVLVTNSGHDIPVQAPEAGVAAVREIVQVVRAEHAGDSRN